MKKGAIHVDWVISVGIFLVYLIALLILIKPSYKSTYEGDVLTTMIKDEFLKQNKIDAGFVVFKAEGCGLEEGVSVIEELQKKLPKNINGGNIYIKEDRIDVAKNIYLAYFLDTQSITGGANLKRCKGSNGEENSVEVAEVVYYNGLKSGLDFNVDNVDEHGVAFSKKFPSSRKYKITVYPGEDKIIPKRDGNSISMGEPSSDDSVYVLDWSAAKLVWDTNSNEIKRGYNDGETIKEGNIIINIQVW